jgi:two-component sensor histidine kinase
MWVKAIQVGERIVLISVRDSGVGLPAGFDPSTSKRLGTRLVKALATQLDAELTQSSSANGTNFTLLVPIEPDAAH